MPSFKGATLPQGGALKKWASSMKSYCGMPVSEEALSHRGRCRASARSRTHHKMPWDRRACQGRGNLQPMALQKKLQGGPAGSPHGASSALNAFNLSAWMPLQVHPAKTLAGNFLFAEIADGGISLVPYRFFMRVDILNLAFGVQWHACSLNEF